MKYSNVYFENLIYQNAEELILSDGVKALNMDRLSALCDMSKTTLYKIVKSKARLMSKLSEILFEKTYETIYGLFTDHMKETHDDDATFEIITTKEISFFRLLVSEIFKEYPEIEVETSELLNRLDNKLILLFTKFQEVGRLKDDIDIKLFLTIFRNTIKFSLLSNQSNDDIIKQINLFYTLLLRSLKN